MKNKTIKQISDEFTEWSKDINVDFENVFHISQKKYNEKDEK